GPSSRWEAARRLRAPAGTDRARSGGLARSRQPPRRRGRRPPGRAVPPGGAVVRARLLAAAGEDAGGDRGLDRDAGRGGTPGERADAGIRRLVRRDLRRRSREPAARSNPLLAGDSLREREAGRTPDRGATARPRRVLRLLRDPLQPRVRAPD